MNAHGVPRMTKDLDVMIRPSTENSQTVFQALKHFGAPLQETSPADFCDLKTMVQLGVEPARIDILQTIPGIDFDKAWNARMIGAVDETLLVPFISREDLITNNWPAEGHKTWRM